jgi:hypothetical protein
LFGAEGGDSPMLLERDHRVVHGRHECHAGRRVRCFRPEVYFHTTSRAADSRGATAPRRCFHPSTQRLGRVSHGSVTMPGLRHSAELKEYGHGI